jgi:hypothetical protein
MPAIPARRNEESDMSTNPTNNPHLPTGPNFLTSVSIYEDGVWAVSGKLRRAENGYVIDDAPAELGTGHDSDDIYDAIAAAIDANDESVEIGGHTYTWDVK